MIKFPTWAVSQTCTAVCLHNTEPTIKIFNSIFRSNYSGSPPSPPVSTCAELHCISNHVANILNSSQTGDALALNANQLVKHYIINADQEILVCNFLDEVFSVSIKQLLLTKILALLFRSTSSVFFYLNI